MLFKIFRRLLMIAKRRKMKSYGKNVKFDPFSFISYETVHCGENIYIGPNAFISSTHSNIFIGSNTIFGPNVSIYGGNHIFDRVGELISNIKKDDTHKDKDVKIGSEVWIGGNVVILTGITIGNGAIVGAGSVVTRDIEPYSINVGNPCKKVAMRFSDSDIEKHESIILSNLI
tara:strand:+ start:673 stop:1191 length:519 start_codon:yes stop_codon:yes gene_type:complete